MNATPNLNNWLVNIDAIALETKKLEAKKEILQNIQDFALLFQRIQEASNMDEFNRIVSEDAEAANDSSFTEPLNTSKGKAVNNISYESNSEIVETEKETTSKISLWLDKKEINEDIVDKVEEETVTNEVNNNEEPSSPPKIKLNLSGFMKSANDWSDESSDDEEKKAA